MKFEPHVYFMRPVGRSGPIKIGCSSHPVQRLRQVTLWSPDVLEIVLAVPASFHDERRLHRYFKAQRRHHEWFEVSPELESLITALRDGMKVVDWIAAREQMASAA